MSVTRARFIDVHILHSVPFSNLNRDDTNSVKTVQYGNSLRTRISSQSWKRAARTDFERHIGQAALRTRRIGERVTLHLSEDGWPTDLAQRAGAHVAAASGIKFELAKAKDPNATEKAPPTPVPNKVLTNALLYVPDTAIAELAVIAEEHRAELESAKDIKKPTDKSILSKEQQRRVEAVLRSRNGVINVFGRMLAEIDDANVDGAVQVAHALTTHETDVETDYFSAVDDVTRLWGDATGSGHMGHAEFSSGTFYRFATIDLDDLASNIGPDPQAARELVSAFLHAFIRSLPQAKKNATAPHTAPDLVHLAVRGDRPLSFASAFEEPVRAADQGGYAIPSRTALTAYATAVNTLMGSRHIVTAGWASSHTKDLEGIGQRHDSFDELVDQAVTAALPQDTAGASA
ncbi:type I-E CRISPR-associated protein Cas7/Cse4/CasC [Streptomyces virginiae]|uniref:type I-E CRISPR-associated protein Cas7/Cse4/CasC n=1 Tax=Streptomyces virginiae TaxID=1961 RepID=UPI00381275A6